jgi:hypothetical protein
MGVDSGLSIRVLLLRFHHLLTNLVN